MNNEFSGNIIQIRALEDCIRATKRYTEGIGTVRAKHPVQGENFSSKRFCKYYEVYPHTEISWNMPAGVAVDWLFGEVPMVEVIFTYDYRVNRATARINNGWLAVKELKRAIPGFGRALASTNGNVENEKVVTNHHIRS